MRVLKILTFIGTLSTILVTSFAAHCEVQTNSSLRTAYPYNSMGMFLDQIAQTGTLPVRESGMSLIPITKTPIPAIVSELFQKIQIQVFGRELLGLNACKECYAFADYRARLVYLQPSFLAQLIRRYGHSEGRVLIKFIIAHEIAHFVHEASIGLGYSPNLSLAGTESAVLKHPLDQNNAQSGLALHAEVDAYAFMIMKKMTSVKPLIITRWFQAERRELQKSKDPNLQNAIKDVERRLLNAEQVIQELWP